MDLPVGDGCFSSSALATLRKKQARATCTHWHRTAAATPRHAAPHHTTPRHATPRHATPQTTRLRAALGHLYIGLGIALHWTSTTGSTTYYLLLGHLVPRAGHSQGGDRAQPRQARQHDAPRPGRE
eukprot:scaffold34018_cov75-Phaeocystis_antarctica.AAC.3